MRKPMVNGHQIAVWSGASSFFATVLAIGAINILNPDDRIRFVGALFVGLITAGAVYTRERLVDARNLTKKYGGDIVITEVEGKKVFTLELNDDPHALDNKSEIMFKIVKRK